MARLIDTSVFVAMERQGIPLSALAAALHGEPIGIASITASELLVGYYKSRSARRQTQRLEFIETVLHEFPVVKFDLEAARTHARIAVELAASGQPIGAHDLIIAATALTIGFDVLTHNVRHYARVPGLKVTVPGF